MSPQINSQRGFVLTANIASGVTASATTNVTKADLRNLRVIGQADKKYIVAFAGGKILAFDQHAADERAQLEKFPVLSPLTAPLPQDLDIWSQEKVNVTLTLTDDEFFALDAYRTSLFEKWGFLFKNLQAPSIKQKAQVTLIAVPVILKEPLNEKDFQEFLQHVLINTDVPHSTLRPPAVKRIYGS